MAEEKSNNILSFEYVQQRNRELEEEKNKKLESLSKNGDEYKEAFKKINENLKKVLEKVDNSKSDDSNDEIVDSVKKIEDKIDSIKDDKNDYNEASPVAMFAALKASRDMIAGLLTYNKEMAVNSSNLLSVISENEGLSSTNAKKFLSSNSPSEVIELVQGPDGVFREPSKGLQIYESQLVKPESAFNKFNVANGDESQLTKMLKTPNGKIVYENSKLSYAVFGESKSGKKIDSIEDVIKGNAKKSSQILDEMKKTTKLIKGIKSIGGIAAGIATIAGIMYASNALIESIIGDGNVWFARLMRTITTGVAIISGLVVANKFGFNLLKIAFDRLSSILMTKNNVPIGGGTTVIGGGTTPKGGTPVKGGLGKVIGGGITGLGLGILGSLLFGLAGEKIGGLFDDKKNGENGGSSIGGMVGSLGGGLLLPFLISKFAPGIMSSAGGLLTGLFSKGLLMGTGVVGASIYSGVKSVGYFKDAYDDEKGRGTNIAQGVIAAAGPILGLALGGPPGLLIGTAVSTIANALIDYNKKTEEINENIQKSLEDDEETSNYDEDVSLNKSNELTNENVNRENLAKCVNDMNEVVALSNKTNSDIMNKLEESENSLKRAKMKYNQNINDISESNAQVAKNQLKVFNSMDSHLQNIYSNTKSNTVIGWS